MIHVRIRPAEWCDLRLAYTETVSYPRLDYVIPSRKIRASHNLDMGNPGCGPNCLRTSTCISRSMGTGSAC